MASASAALVLTGIPWRTTWKYTERGYRHLFWDAGMILANLTALAAGARLPTRVVTGFADDEVEALLGIDGRREFPLCLLSLGAGPPVEPAPEPAVAEVFESPPLSPREVEFPEIREVNDAGRLPSGGAAARWRERGASPRAEAVGPDGATDDSIEAVIIRRGSARAFRPRPVPPAVLVDILARATVGVATDIAPNGSRLVCPYLVAHDLQGLEPGAYVFESGALRLLREGRFRQETAFLCLEQQLGGAAAATHFLMADPGAVLGAHGDRGYRVAQLEGGIVAGRIYLGAYGHRLGATGLTFYDDEVTAFFSPDAAGLSCLLVVAVGESTRLLAEVP
jgi:nitroreductase